MVVLDLELGSTFLNDVILFCSFDDVTLGLFLLGTLCSGKMSIFGFIMTLVLTLIPLSRFMLNETRGLSSATSSMTSPQMESVPRDIPDKMEALLSVELSRGLLPGLSWFLSNQYVSSSLP